MWSDRTRTACPLLRSSQLSLAASLPEDLHLCQGSGRLSEVSQQVFLAGCFAWDDSKKNKEEAGSESIYLSPLCPVMQQGGRRKSPLACFCCGGCWAGRAGGLVCEAVNKPQCTGAALGGTGDSAPESRLWCPLNAGGTCLHPSGIAHGLLFTLGCPAPGLTRAELSFLSIFHGQEMLPSPLPGLETNSEGLRDLPKA